jgi:hypothetical protein
MKCLALFFSLVMFWLPLSTEAKCEAVLTAFQTGAARACRVYRSNYCPLNSLSVVERVRHLIGDSPALQQSKVLYIFDRDFYSIRPKHIRNPGRLKNSGWKFHVVVDTPFGIIDLDSENVRTRSELIADRTTYFDRSFRSDPEYLDHIMVVPIPALQALQRYLENLEGSAVYLPIGRPIGWAQKEWEKYGTIVQEQHFISTFFSSPHFYMLTHQGRTEFPPQPLRQYLVEAERTSQQISDSVEAAVTTDTQRHRPPYQVRVPRVKRPLTQTR